MIFINKKPFLPFYLIKAFIFVLLALFIISFHQGCSLFKFKSSGPVIFGGSGGGGGNNSGTLDTSFGNQGIVTFDYNAQDDIVRTMAIYNDKIYIAGETGLNAFLLKYNSNGDLDTSFGNQGTVIFDNNGRFDYFRTMAIYNNYIYLAGETYYNTGPNIPIDALLIKYDLNGNLDNSFGNNNGFATFGDNVNAYRATTMVIYNNYIYLAGEARIYGNNVSGDVLLLRCDLNGNLDTSFGNQGIVIFNNSNYNNWDIARAIAIHNNAIYLAGNTIQGNNEADILLLKYDLNGNLDTSFGNNGLVTFNNPNNPNGNSNDNGASMAIYNNKIYIAGTSFQNNTDILLLRYDLNGNLDTSFGNQGFVNFDNSNLDMANSMVLDSNGNIYVAGRTSNDLLLLKYLPDGTLDNSFGNNGVVIFGNYNSAGNSIAIYNNFLYVAGVIFGNNIDALLLRFFK